MNHHSFKIGLLALPMLAFLGTAQAQETEPGENTATINITITEDGETTTITREVPVEDAIDIEEILREYGIEEELEGLESDEELEIILRKHKEGDEQRCHRYHYFQGNEFEHEHEHEHGMNDIFIMDDMAGKPLLGVHIQDNGEEVKGALISNVMEGTGAEEAGLEPGDVIIKINGEPTPGYEEVIDVLKDLEVGETVAVSYLRDGAEQQTNATLSERKPNVMFFDDGEDFEFEFDVEGQALQMEALQAEMERLQMTMQGMEFEGEDRAFLGVSPSCGGDDEKGVRLGGVTANSTAEEMGLQKGDVIVKMNGQSVNSFDELSEVIEGSEIGDKMKIELLREGSKMKLDGELKNRKDVLPNENVFIFDGEMLEDLELELAEGLENAMRYEKEIRISVRVDEITAEEAAALSQNTDMEIKPESDLAVSRVEFAPNPTTGSFTLNMDLPEKGNTQLRLLDATGRQVYSENLGDFQGFYRREIDISSEQDGMYFLIITQGDKQFNKKIIKH